MSTLRNITFAVLFLFCTRFLFACMTANAHKEADEKVSVVISLPDFKPGEPYAKIRERLLVEGWRPVVVPYADTCDDDPRCIGRPEMEACAGTGLANCKFLWRKDGVTLSVFTVGMDAEYKSRHLTSNSSDSPSR